MTTSEKPPDFNDLLAAFDIHDLGGASNGVTDSLTITDKMVEDELSEEKIKKDAAPQFIETNLPKERGIDEMDHNESLMNIKDSTNGSQMYETHSILTQEKDNPKDQHSSDTSEDMKSNPSNTNTSENIETRLNEAQEFHTENSNELNKERVSVGTMITPDREISVTSSSEMPTNQIGVKQEKEIERPSESTAKSKQNTACSHSRPASSSSSALSERFTPSDHFPGSSPHSSLSSPVTHIKTEPMNVEEEEPSEKACEEIRASFNLKPSHVVYAQGNGASLYSSTSAKSSRKNSNVQRITEVVDYNSTVKSIGAAAAARSAVHNEKHVTGPPTSLHTTISQSSQLDPQYSAGKQRLPSWDANVEQTFNQLKSLAQSKTHQKKANDSNNRLHRPVGGAPRMPQTAGAWKRRRTKAIYPGAGVLPRMSSPPRPTVVKHMSYVPQRRHPSTAQPPQNKNIAAQTLYLNSSTSTGPSVLNLAPQLPVNNGVTTSNHSHFQTQQLRQIQPAQFNSQAPAVMLIQRAPAPAAAGSTSFGPVLMSSSGAVSTTGPQSLQLTSNDSGPSTHTPTQTVVKTVAVDSVTNPLGPKNPIPCYVPQTPPEKFKMDIPTGGYKCLECGDAFNLESSLSYHNNRRSMMISFLCDACNKALIFYNKCALLGHVRSHAEKGVVVKTYKAVVTPLPKVLMPQLNGTLNVAVKALEPKSNEAEANKQPEKEKPIVLTEGTTVVENRTQIVMKVNPKSRSFVNTKCSECGTNCGSPEGLKEHLRSDLSHCSQRYECWVCQMCLPSNCSLIAHRRIHSRFKPFTCPECGIVFKSDWDLFNQHLYEKCLHFSRITKYACTSCPASYDEIQYLRQHIMITHGESYYKCQSCPMAFKSEASFNSHKQSTHQDDSSVTARVIYKCPRCDTVFHGQVQLNAHLNMHLKDSKLGVHFQFKCSKCKKIYDDKPSLAAHLKEQHQHEDSDLMCAFCHHDLFKDAKHLALHVQTYHCQKPTKIKKTSSIVPTDTQTKTSTHKVEESDDQDATKVQCFLCNAWIRSQKHFGSHAKNHRKHGQFMCQRCNNVVFKSMDELVAHKKICTGSVLVELGEKNSMRHECSYCDDKFKQKEELYKHLKHVHSMIQQFPCQLCSLTYESNHSLKRHIQTIHEGKRKSFVCWLCQEKGVKMSFARRRFLEKHLVQKHRVPKSEIDFSKIPHVDAGTKIEGSSIEEESANNSIQGSCKRKMDGTEADEPIKRLRVEGDTAYTCAKCDFSSENEESFKAHIQNHKPEKSIQCPECGMCFVVVPSLRKHLFIVHKIRSLDKYLSEKSLGEIEIEQEEETSPAGKEAYKQTGDSFECTVCYRTFECEVTMRKHMRTHGVAFIRSKRLTAGDLP